MGVIKILYKVVEEKLFHEHLGIYKSYGIQCYNGRIISDVCTDYKKLKLFVENLNKYNININHIDYFVEQFLEERDSILYKF